METRSLVRPLSSLSLSLSAAAASPTTTSLCPRLLRAVAAVRALTPRRHKSSTARTKRALKIAPHPSFLTPPSESNHIIYNPPSSEASAYHTPLKFLPPSDPRRQANLPELLRISHSSSSPSPSSSSSFSTSDDAQQQQQPEPRLPPALEMPPKKYNVTKEEVAEMRELRAADPERWSVVRLAERYDCTKLFVMMCCRAPREHADAEYERKQAIKARWGPIRSEAREERKKRKQLLLKGQL
ncbi:mitochondrial ribosomal protein subunit L20-domain-containing protein [Whalleya microplaca]|nr:mitochondrial ribosomal protein subunit L20-domain-containing protein [Whalleya microplaca]